ncbi:MAG: hypothetical protein SGPRY_000422 [Prymnesium sp.]
MHRKKRHSRVGVAAGSTTAAKATLASAGPSEEGRVEGKQTNEPQAAEASRGDDRAVAQLEEAVKSQLEEREAEDRAIERVEEGGEGEEGGEQPEDEEDSSSGRIAFTLILKSGSDLMASDSNGLSDPFVRLALGGKKYKSKVSSPSTPGCTSLHAAMPRANSSHVLFNHKLRSSQVIKKTLDPHWDQSFTFTLTKADLTGGFIGVDVYDYDGMTSKADHASPTQCPPSQAICPAHLVAIQRLMVRHTR